MRRLYTRTGDKGYTAIHGGMRVPKTDIRIEANGTLDELNVALGMVRIAMPGDHSWQTPLKNVQMTLMTVMSIIATPSEARDSNPNKLPESMVDDTERLIDEVTAESGAAEHFILPGGTALAGWLHQARVVARRGERRLWQLNEVDAVPDEILRWINRLSDLFFAMARSEMSSEGVDEERWRAFSYRRTGK